MIHLRSGILVEPEIGAPYSTIYIGFLLKIISKVDLCYGGIFWFVYIRS